MFSGFFQSVFPYKKEYNKFLINLLMSYLITLIIIFIFALIYNGIYGDEWFNNYYANDQSKIGESTLDEVIWLLFCTFHATSFGDYYPHSSGERVIVCITSFIGYIFLLFIFSLILLSQIAGEKQPTMISTIIRIIKASYALYICLIILLLIMAAIIQAFEKDIERDIIQEEEEIRKLHYETYLYYVWQVFCSTPFGEILPKTLGGKIFTQLVGLIGILYRPYVLALISIRKPSKEEHKQLVDKIINNKDDLSVLGSGYVLPLYNEEIEIESVKKNQIIQE